MNNVCSSNGSSTTNECNSDCIVASRSSETCLLDNGQASTSSGVKTEGQIDQVLRANPLAAPIFIDLTQTSDEESNAEDLFSEHESNDSDVEIISHRSRSPLSISTRGEHREVSAAVPHPAAGSSSSSIEGSSVLAGPSVLAPSETHISVIQHHISRPQYIFPISPVTPLALPSQIRTAAESVQSASPPSRAFQRPRDDVIDWLNEIEPFNPFSNVSDSVASSSSVNSNNSSNGLVEVNQQWSNSDNDRHVHCGHCGQSFRLDSSNDHAQPSTSARRSNDVLPRQLLHDSHLRHSRSAHRRHNHVTSNNSNNSNSVLERMLSTPPLPLFEEPVQPPSSFINPSQSNILPPHVQPHFQQMAINFGIPPPAHSGSTNASVTVDRDYVFSTRSRVDVPFGNLSNLRPAPDFRPNFLPTAAHGSATSGFASNTLLPTIQPEMLSRLSGPVGSIAFYAHPQAHAEPPSIQPRANSRYVNPLSQALYQPNPFIMNPTPVDFLPASVILQGFYPDFPGFGLSSTQIERHTVKYVLEKITKLEYDAPPAAKKAKASYADEREASCSVCLEGFDEGQTLRRLTCQHLFHADCVDEWLKRRPTCPNCRVDVRRSSNNNNNVNNFGEPSSSTSTSNIANYNNLHSPFRIPHRRIWPFTTNQ